MDDNRVLSNPGYIISIYICFCIRTPREVNNLDTNPALTNELIIDRINALSDIHSFARINTK